MLKGIRFSPPNSKLDDNVAWVLTRAFAPPVTTERAPHHERLDCARRLRLLPRILSRTPRNLLVADLGEAATERLVLEHRRQVARGLGIRRTQQQVADAAHDLDTSLVLLKFAALCELGCTSPASREACDLDVLVDANHAAALADRLCDIGYKCPPRRGPPHQPYVLHSPAGIMVELHVHIPYLRLGAEGSFATLDMLKSASVVGPLDPDDETVLIPSRSLMAAHLILHGMVQHGFEPQTYPGWRLISDLTDLGFSEDQTLQADSRRWIETCVSAEEIDALSVLITTLRLGRVDALWPSSDGAALLLRHHVLVVTDGQYRARVMLRRQVQALREEGLAKWARSLWTYAFALPDANLRRIYQHSKLSMFWLRVLRPADFAWRGFRRAWRAVFRRSS